MNAVVIHYKELALKGRNRPWFIQLLVRNVKAALASGRVKIKEGDIRDAALVDAQTKGVDYVFHQAALRITRCAEAPRSTPRTV